MKVRVALGAEEVHFGRAVEIAAQRSTHTCRRGSDKPTCLLTLIAGRRHLGWGQLHRHLLFVNLENVELFSAVGLCLIDVDDVVRDVVDVEPGVSVSKNGSGVVGLLTIAHFAQVVGVRRALTGAARTDTVDVAAIQVDFPFPFLR